MIAFIFLSLFYPINIFSEDNTKIVIDTITNKGEAILLYEDKSWEYLSVEQRKRYLENFADTSIIFTQKWSNIIFPYREKNPPDSVLITYLDSLDEYCIPVIDRINSGFAFRRGVFHKGIDVHLTTSTKVKAAFNGKVRYARFNSGGYGNLVIIRHFNGLETYYAHLSKIHVKENQYVQSCDVIGLGGNTGAKWSGPHLHFEVRYHDFAFDPAKMFSIKDSSLINNEILLKKSDFHTIVSASKKYHTIKSGQTLSHLAVKYNTTIPKILKINRNLSINSVIGIGKRIRVR